MMLSAALLSGLALSGCGSAQLRSLETSAAKAFLSDQEEEQLGAQVKQKLEREPGFRYVQDPIVVDYVRQVAGRVLEQARRDRPGVKWEVHVVDAPDKVNAFATPGGDIYVYSGLITAVDAEAELAGVLAHEAGHVTGRHVARQLVDAFGLQAITGLLLGQNPGLLAQITSTVAGQGVLLAHSREQEREADDLGVRYAAEAGYDPRGLVAFLDSLAQGEPARPGVLEWLSSHPTSSGRVDRLMAIIEEDDLAGGEIGRERIAPIQRRIAGGDTGRRPM